MSMQPKRRSRKATLNNEAQGEPQYRNAIAFMQARGLERLGLMSSWGWYDDPKRLAFTLSRYKFVAKMLEGKQRVLEVGCSDAFASRIVAQAVGHLTAVDFDPEFIACSKEIMSDRWPIRTYVHDMLQGPVVGSFNAVYSLDVLEHIPSSNEERFLTNMFKPLMHNGIAIIGMPSLESQSYASSHSREGHVNCKSMPDFKRLIERFFENVLAFSMNDEVIHTGFHSMAHYLFCIGIGKKKASRI
jgi:2-polyprenyl-3-methyl-5-hydroxy-6-metoxy-1,4-benzoquinol methylase